MEINTLTERIIAAAIKVHTALGPGLLESVYLACLQHELTRHDLKALSQVILPIAYDGLQIDAGLRIDLLVEDTVIVELKAVERVLPVHQAQVLSYLKLSGKHIGLLINFNVPHLKQGIRRIVNGL